MKWYGSIENRLEENAISPIPTIGMGVTEMLYTDRMPYEVVAITDDRHISVRKMNHTRIDTNGISDCQQYKYTSDPDAEIVNLFKSKDGKWR